jgi:hypothetical protein
MAVIVVVPDPDTDTGLPRIAGALVSSLRAVRGQVPAADRIAVVEFADLRARPESGPIPVEGLALERAVLEGWWNAAVRTGQGRNEGHLQDAATALSATVHFAQQTKPPHSGAAQLRRYLTDRKYRHELRDRTQACLGPETKVVVGHALGGLIAYETLCAVGDGVAVTLVTLGPSLCGPRVVFDLLEPQPRNNQGEWPAAVRHWFNIVAHTDVTALSRPELTARFGPGIEDLTIEPRAVTDSLSTYLLDRSTGLAVATGLSAEVR